MTENSEPQQKKEKFGMTPQSNPEPMEATPLAEYQQKIRDMDQLLDIYNNNQRDFSEKMRRSGLTVNMSLDSVKQYRSGFDTTITFNESRTGKFVVFTEYFREHNSYYLFPKPGMTFNQHQYQSMRLIFELNGWERRSSRQFILKKPAIVEYRGNQILLKEQGILSFS